MSKNPRFLPFSTRLRPDRELGYGLSRKPAKAIDLNDADKQPGLINSAPQNNDAPVSKPTRQIVDDVGPFRWLQPTPIYCDHYIANSFGSGSIIRISFGEYIGKDYYSIWRTAVAMPLSDVKLLVRRLTKLIEEADKEAEEALAARAALRESE